MSFSEIVSNAAIAWIARRSAAEVVVWPAIDSRSALIDSASSHCLKPR